ncbi:MAG: ribosome maturation factor RimP [Candidatus Endonucleobacter sp. (ex Gigantidas childressi)]|nr:ribosome maturation factor RimP [Candidatus Endonucleobacter sp. (ex Gigantidas childressi)]
MKGKQSQLEAIIDPIVRSLDYRLWGVEFVSKGGQHSLLRIYIDSDHGVDLGDCEKVSRQVSSVFDVEDPIAEEYTLEVSSPGMNRPLFRLEHYEAWAGAEVKICLHVSFEGRRKYRGLIKGVEGQDVVIVTDDHEFLLPIENIDKAQVVPRFD